MKSYFAPARPRVFAHRGLAVATDAHAGAPENTLLSFAAAVAAGVEYVETDVHATKDGVAVVAHDPNLTRVAGMNRRISSFTMDELRSVDLGHGQSFCTLVDALEALPDTRFNIDLKTADAVPSAVAAIVTAAAVDRVLVTSFSEARRMAAVSQLPGVATSTGATRFARALAAAKLGSLGAVRRILAGVDAVQVPTRYGPLAITSPGMVQILHDAGVEVHVWTINDPAQMHALLDAGVDGLVTDRADLAMAVLAERS